MMAYGRSTIEMRAVLIIIGGFLVLWVGRYMGHYITNRILFGNNKRLSKSFEDANRNHEFR
jgi:hypothetical protein